MKKYILILAMAMSLAATSQAQDTISSKGPKSNYLVMHDWWWKADSIWGYGNINTSFGGDMARLFYSKDTLTVYGIAAALITGDYYARATGTYPESVYMPIDTTHDLTESLRLYEYDAAGNTLIQVGEDLPVNAMRTPITYYQQMTQMSLGRIGEMTPAFPVYERYFNEPQVVTDTFYAGLTQKNSRLEGSQEATWNFVVVGLSANNHGFLMPTMSVAQQQWERLADGTDGWKWAFAENRNFHDWFLFPILTPEHNDTTGVDTTQTDTTGRGDTQGVERHDMMERMVAVTPNPAKTQVKVACGMGLTLVEVFDASGKQVLSEKASGMVHRLDVAGWPQGVYAVVVHTPLGKVTKKLLVE